MDGTEGGLTEELKRRIFYGCMEYIEIKQGHRNTKSKANTTHCASLKRKKEEGEEK